MVHITSLVIEYMPFNNFPINYGETFCCHGNQTKRYIGKLLAILNCPYPRNICTNFRVTLLQWFWRLSFKQFLFLIYCYHGNQTKWPLLIKHRNWVDIHQMIISAKYGSDHFNGYGEFVTCVEVLQPSQPNGVMASVVSLPNYTFTGQA